jgi:diguanylate cyclase (GGDEF)-like protein
MARDLRPLADRCRAVLEARGWPAAFVVYGALFAEVILSGSFSEATRSLIANLWYLPIGGASAVLAWQVTRTAALPAKQRIAWRLIALALVATFISDSLWIYVENYRGADPSGNLLANIGYLLYYPALLVSLLLLPGALRSRRDTLKFALDMTTVVVAGMMTVWHFVVAPTVATHNPSPMAFFLALAYPIGDLLLIIGLAAILLRYPAGSRRWPMMWLAGSAASMLVGDVVWAHLSLSGSFDAGNIQDIPYLIQYVLFGIGIAEERRRLARPDRDQQEQSAGGFTVLPYVAVLGGYAMLMDLDWKHLRGELLPIIGALVLTVLVVRQVLALRENVHLEDKAYYDPLTGLGNRLLFNRRVEDALSRHHGEGVVAVLFVDLDDFKIVNDTYGHGVGDAAIRAAARRIMTSLRMVDTAARLGGDEFGILLDDPDGRISPAAVAERVAKAFQTPLTLDHREVLVRASVGVAVALPGEAATDVERHADLAMYSAKRRGGGRVAVFEPSMTRNLDRPIDAKSETADPGVWQLHRDRLSPSDKVH